MVSIKEQEMHLLRAIELAEESVADGGAPFGAVIVQGITILAEARNQTRIRDNPILHAEIVAINDTCAKFGPEPLKNSTIFCSCEPCAMCLLAIYYSGISRVVFAATLEDAISYGSGDPLFHAEWLNQSGNLELEIVNGNNRQRAVALFETASKHGEM